MMQPGVAIGGFLTVYMDDERGIVLALEHSDVGLSPSEALELAAALARFAAPSIRALDGPASGAPDAVRLSASESTGALHAAPPALRLCSCVIVTGGHRAWSVTCPLHGRDDR